MYFLILLASLPSLRRDSKSSAFKGFFFLIALQNFLDLTSFLLKYRKLACIVGEGRKISMTHGKIEVFSLNTSYYIGDKKKSQ